jgi:hypothetical protein
MVTIRAVRELAVAVVNSLAGAWALAALAGAAARCGP